ncbi:MAG: hypothetical protein V3T72_21545 [Thermoanaerobaculia bacterium]
MRIAYFISSHGFGHAARACAVMAAVHDRQPDLHFELFTSVPRWFFEDSLGHPVDLHAGGADFGWVQTDALQEDLPATVAALKQRIPFQSGELDHLARRLEELGVGLVICDIAPVGLAAARRAGLPSLLIENFTWDWIYRHYAETEPDLEPIADDLGELFDSADVHIQTEPCCRPLATAQQVAPVSRRPRQNRRATRRQLGIPEDAAGRPARLVMVTMGGIEWDYADLERRLAARGRDNWWLLVAGAADEPRRVGQAILLPHRSDFYHPDLIHAADGVIGKLGYSTLAEIAAAGVAFGYVPRPGFAESPVLEAWVREHLPHLRVEAESFVSGRWLDQVETLLSVPRRRRPIADGGDEIARRIVTWS